MAMLEQTVIVWDLEAVPDIGAAARMLDMTVAADAEVRVALGGGFPKKPLHKIVCIGALVASHQKPAHSRKGRTKTGTPICRGLARIPCAPVRWACNGTSIFRPKRAAESFDRW
jgi:hypothetical protein